MVSFKNEKKRKEEKKNGGRRVGATIVVLFLRGNSIGALMYCAHVGQGLDNKKKKKKSKQRGITCFIA